MNKFNSPIIKMDYENLLNALDKTHTLSVADVCEFLKVGRNWVSEYITSNVPHIFIQGTKSVPNWRAIINFHLNKSDSELIWFNPDQLFSFTVILKKTMIAKMHCRYRNTFRSRWQKWKHMLLVLRHVLK